MRKVRVTMKKAVILIGMIVILSLTSPAVFADGAGGGQRPEDDPSPAPEEAQQLVATLLRDLIAFHPEFPTPHDDAGSGMPGPGDVPNQEGAPSVDLLPPDLVPCTEDVADAAPCGEREPSQQDPTPPTPEPPAPADQEAPAAPEVDPAEDLPEVPTLADPVEELPDESLLHTLLAPMQAAAKSATDNAKVVLTGAVTTAGFVATEAAEQAQAQANHVAHMVGGTLTLVTDILEGILVTQTLTSGEANEGGLQTQGAEAAKVAGPANYVTLGLIAVGSIGLIAAAFAGLRKLLGLGGIALLSRIPSKDIMKNDTRATIFEIVQSDPGVSLNEIVDRLGLSRNAVAYHLAVFESEKTVVSVKDGKYRRYFVNGGKYVNGAKDVVSTIKNDVTLNVIRYILDHPGVMQKQVCSAVGTSPSATNWHINRLEKVGLVEKAKVANTVRYSPGPSFAKYDLAEFGLAAQTA